MPYQDDPSSDQDFQFAHSQKKTLSARDRKRELELKIQNSMSTLQGRQPTNSSHNAYSSPESSFQSYGTSYSDDHRSNPQHPLPDSQYYYGSGSTAHPPHSQSHQSTSGMNGNAGILESVFQCVGTAIQVGASELVPTNLYQNIKSVMNTTTTTSQKISDDAGYLQPQQKSSSALSPFGSSHYGGMNSSYQSEPGSYGSTSSSSPTTFGRR